MWAGASGTYGPSPPPPCTHAHHEAPGTGGQAGNKKGSDAPRECQGPGLSVSLSPPPSSGWPELLGRQGQRPHHRGVAEFNTSVTRGHPRWPGARHRLLGGDRRGQAA